MADNKHFIHFMYGFSQVVAKIINKIGFSKINRDAEMVECLLYLYLDVCICELKSKQILQAHIIIA